MKASKYQMIAVTVSCLLAVCGLATPPYGDPNQPYDKIPGTWETEHVKWSKPLSGGKLKVLFIVPYTTCREVVELAQRLDIDYSVIMSAGRATWDQAGYEGANATPLHGIESVIVLEALSKKRLNPANEYDSIVIGGVSWLALPDYVRELILKHVERGTGLVYVSPNRIEKMVYDGLRLVSGGQLVTNDAPQFATLFLQNENPAISQTVFDALPMDCLPLKVLSQVEEFKTLKPLQSRWWEGIRAQNPVCISSSSLGKGRILGLHYFDAELNKVNKLTCLTPNVEYDPVSYDYLCALLAKCVIWSAGKESAVKPGIDIQGPATELKAPKDEELTKKYCWDEKTPAKVIARNELGKAKVLLSAELVSGQAKAVILEYSLRNAKGELLAQESFPLGVQSGKKENREVRLPPLGRGNYFVGLRVLDQDKQVMDFASKSFRVENPLKVQAIELDKEAYQPGEVINGKVSFSQALAGEQKAEVKAVDTWGRVVKKGEVKLDEGKTNSVFSLPVELPLCRLWDVVCDVSDKEGVIDSATTWIGIPDWNFNEFIFWQWLGPIPDKDFKGRYVTQSMKRYGLNAVGSALIHGVSYQYELAERYGVMNIFQAEHLGQRDSMKPLDLNKEFSGACLSEFSRMARYVADTGKFPDPKEFPYKSGWMDAQWFKDRAVKRYQESTKFASPFYMIHAENHLVGEVEGKENTCFCPLCTKLFQKWCKKTYGDDVKRLNDEWGSDFKSFDEVRGILIQDAVEKNQMPRWVDFRYFMRSQVFTQLLIDWTDMIRRFVPQARTADCVWDNCDYSRFRDHMTSGDCGASDMGGVKPELHQSFSSDTGYMIADSNTLRWEPEFQTPRDNVRFPWKYLFLGFKGLKLGCEQYDMLGGDNYMTADYSEPLPFFKNISAEVMLLQKGAGTFILTAKPVRSKVAILWSPYNHYISRLFPFQDNGFSGGSHANVSAGGGAIGDCLIMLRSIRIRPTFIGPQDVEAGELEKQGYRALMLPYSKGLSVAEAEAIKKFVKAGGVVIADNEPGICTEHGRVLKEGRLKELFPVTDRKNIVRYGKGVAAYLPNEINGYAARLARSDYTGSDSVAVILKDRAGIQPPVELTGKDGLPRRDTLMGVFSQGSTLMVGLLRQLESEGKEMAQTTMLLPAPCHVWDLREKKYCGYVDRMEINLDLYPRCYVLLPANPREMTLTLDKTAVRQGEALTVKGKVEFGPGKDAAAMGQCAHVEVMGPGGKEAECFRKNIVFQGNLFEVKLPVSFSEQVGRYTITVEHVITGMKVATCFDVVGN